jgi:NADPH-dependent 2,4-dienoyl-CoA reductase/sulfur reductase-like enzyme
MSLGAHKKGLRQTAITLSLLMLSVIPGLANAQNTNHDVVIVGAGAAGIQAAYDLNNMGFSVLVLEAENRVGGRVYNTVVADPSFATYEQAIGASYVEGLQNNQLYDDAVALYGSGEFTPLLT